VFYFSLPPSLSLSLSLSSLVSFPTPLSLPFLSLFTLFNSLPFLAFYLCIFFSLSLFLSSPPLSHPAKMKVTNQKRDSGFYLKNKKNKNKNKFKFKRFSVFFSLYMFLIQFSCSILAECRYVECHSAECRGTRRMAPYYWLPL
jgi:hypothetical protein